MSNERRSELLKCLRKRESLIKYLIEDTTGKRALTEKLDVSRPTVDRAFRELEEIGFIESQGTDYRPTLYGQLAFEQYEMFTNTIDQLLKGEDMFIHLPPSRPIDYKVLEGAEIRSAPRHAPHEPLLQVRELVKPAHQITGLSPVVLPDLVRLFHEQIVENRVAAEFILQEPLIETITANYKNELDEVLESGRASFRETNEMIPFGLLIIDDETVWVGIYDLEGSLQGTITNDSTDAVAWATEIYQSYRNDSQEVLFQGDSSPAPRLEDATP